VGKLYTVPFVEVAVTAAQDFFEITAPATRVLVVHQLELSQSTEVGDSAEEMLPLTIRRGTSATTSGSGGSTVTPAPLEANQGAAAFTAEANNTTVMSGGTITTLVATGWNVRAVPTTWLWSPETRPVVSPSERLVVRLGAAPADSVTISGTLWVEEMG